MMRTTPGALRGASAAGYLSLLTSSGTLVCCTLPALLVALGAGTTLASVVTVFPALVWLSEYKEVVFGVAATMLVVAGAFHFRARYAPCPVDQAESCRRARRTSLRVYLLSVAIFSIGGLFAFVAPELA